MLADDRTERPGVPGLQVDAQVFLQDLGLSPYVPLVVQEQDPDREIFFSGFAYLPLRADGQIFDSVAIHVAHANDRHAEAALSARAGSEPSLERADHPQLPHDRVARSRAARKAPKPTRARSGSLTTNSGRWSPSMSGRKPTRPREVLDVFRVLAQLRHGSIVTHLQREDPTPLRKRREECGSTPRALGRTAASQRLPQPDRLELRDAAGLAYLGVAVHFAGVSQVQEPDGAHARRGSRPKAPSRPVLRRQGRGSRPPFTSPAGAKADPKAPASSRGSEVPGVAPPSSPIFSSRTTVPVASSQSDHRGSLVGSARVVFRRTHEEVREDGLRHSIERERGADRVAGTGHAGRAARPFRPRRP